MGSIISSAMDQNMEKQQIFMQETQNAMLERQIQMNNQMRERQAAMMLSRVREMCTWLGSFYALYLGVAIIGMKKNRAILAPVLPLTFIVGYQFDLAYGNKMERIRVEADKILENEGYLLQLPHGLPTLESLDRERCK